MADRLTDAELIARLKAHAKFGPGPSADKFKISGAQWRASISEAKRRGLTAVTPVIDETAKLRTKVKTLEAELGALTRDNITADEVRQKIFGLAEMTGDVPSWTYEPLPGQSSGVPVALWSDFHWGEVVQATEIGGSNEFNRKIAKQRLKTLAETTIDLSFNHMRYPNYKGIVVVLGGDMLSGDIHEELRETNEAPSNVILLEVFEELAAALQLQADAFGNVFVVGTVGNHPRQSKKPRSKLRVVTNFDWLLYCMLERHFKNDARFKFLIPQEPDAHFAVHGYRFMATHGDSIGVKGGDGIIGMLGPITRGAVKVGRSEAQVGRDFDCLLLAHWHTYVPKTDASAVMVNGTLKGYDEYAHTELRAPYAPPTQALFFVHPKWGITAQWPVRLDTKRKSAEARKAKWVSWETRA